MSPKRRSGPTGIGRFLPAIGVFTGAPPRGFIIRARLYRLAAVVVVGSCASAPAGEEPIDAVADQDNRHPKAADGTTHEDIVSQGCARSVRTKHRPFSSEMIIVDVPADAPPLGCAWAA